MCAQQFEETTAATAEAKAEVDGYGVRATGEPGYDEVELGGVPIVDDAAVGRLVVPTPPLGQQFGRAASATAAEAPATIAQQSQPVSAVERPTQQAAPSTRARRINFGHSRVEALDPETFPFDSDPRYDYYLLAIPFTIGQPPWYAGYESVAVHFDLETPDAIALGLAPDHGWAADRIEQWTVDEKYWLNAGLELVPGKVSVGGGVEKAVSFTRTVTSVRAMNHYRNDPYWVYHRPRGVEYGSRWAVMTISMPADRSVLEGTAHAKAKYQPFGTYRSDRVSYAITLPETGVRIERFLSR
ncbi:hypothetical protein I7X12_10130 [Halosimplex litoreum]|uniref:Uncharacterized protein n=1 Tax=Halosimplex litoreum TaxID=1198301 RepID=A0A7U3WBD9_9EURY|nr:hypothetical protein [Halosimplex litoreum]QPV64934.1 hypothetical protein I7X12_10130 [Halosimplex litoreum]